MPVRDGWQETALGGAVAFAGASVVVMPGVARDAGAAVAVTILVLLGFAAGLMAMRRATARDRRDVLAMTRGSSDLPRQRQRLRLDATGIEVQGRRPEEAASVARWHGRT